VIDEGNVTNKVDIDLPYLARLARINLSDAELETYRPQLLGILNAVARISEVATPSVEPMSHVIELVNVTRKDEVQPGLSAQEALSGAPAQEGDRFVVPRILGEG
jgi:aspartyl-tRNA(Asn)/glutamyl-tRNA(Gln) amidotransferase subunit C